jgi:hypothetical protein
MSGKGMAQRMHTDFLDNACFFYSKTKGLLHSTVLKADFENLTRVASGKKGSNFPELHRVVMNLKSWLRGVHHHVNDLQDYLNEYCYRFNRSFMKENIFDNLMKRMIEAEPCYIKNISQ